MRLLLESSDRREYRVGARYALGPLFNLSVEGVRHESLGAPPVHGLMLTLRASLR